MYTLLIPISQNRSSTSLQNSYMAHLEEMENTPVKVRETFQHPSWWWLSLVVLYVLFVGKFWNRVWKELKYASDYAPTSVRKPHQIKCLRWNLIFIIPILTASNLLQTYEWFVRNLVHCLGWYHVVTPGPCFFWSPKCLRCTQLPRNKQLCQRNLFLTVSREVFPESKVFFGDLVGIARAGVAAEFSGLTQKRCQSPGTKQMCCFFQEVDVPCFWEDDKSAQSLRMTSPRNSTIFKFHQLYPRKPTFDWESTQRMISMNQDSRFQSPPGWSHFKGGSQLHFHQLHSIRGGSGSLC